MTDAATASEDGTGSAAGSSAPAEAVKLFGDPRSALVARGPDRRARSGDDAPADPPNEPAHPDTDRVRIDLTVPAHRGLRLGRGDGFATALNVLGVLVILASTVMSAIILYNANQVGAFSNPLDSNRLAIGLAVLALGWVHGACLIGVARAITYQLASLRVRLLDGRDHAPKL